MRSRVTQNLIDNDVDSQRDKLTELLRGEHRNANASVAARVDRHSPTSVNGDSLMDVVRVVEKAERTNAKTANLSQYFELTSRSVGAMYFTMVNVELVIACADGKDAHDRTAFVYQKEDLSLEIYFQVRVATVLRQRPNCYPKGGKFLASQLTGSLAAFDFLKGN